MRGVKKAFPNNIIVVVDKSRNRLKYYYPFTPACIAYIGSSKVDSDGRFVKSATLMKFLNGRIKF